jgi:hypothetical protein
MENIIFMRVKVTRDRLAAALEMLESVDDPAPGKVDYLAIAAAVDDAVKFFDLILMRKSDAAN